MGSWSCKEFKSNSYTCLCEIENVNAFYWKRVEQSGEHEDEVEGEGCWEMAGSRTMKRIAERCGRPHWDWRWRRVRALWKNWANRIDVQNTSVQSQTHGYTYNFIERELLQGIGLLGCETDKSVICRADFQVEALRHGQRLQSTSIVENNLLDLKSASCCWQTHLKIPHSCIARLLLDGIIWVLCSLVVMARKPHLTETKQALRTNSHGIQFFPLQFSRAKCPAYRSRGELLSTRWGNCQDKNTEGYRADDGEDAVEEWKTAICLGPRLHWEVTLPTIKCQQYEYQPHRLK